jgi:hypothetical protein
MKQRFILYRRKVGGMFYIEDTETRKQESLCTKDRAEAKSLLNARNESVRHHQPIEKYEHKNTRVLGERPASARCSR